MPKDIRDYYHKKSDYQPYATEAIQRLLQWCYQKTTERTKPILKITVECGFEAFYGRASETWEHRFVIECDDPIFYVEGETLNDACLHALAQIHITERVLEKIDKTAAKLLTK